MSLGSGGNLSDNNAANDPLASTAPAGDPAHIALENNAHQLELFSKGDFGASDTVDQAIEEATSLYFMSNGVYQTNPYVGETTIGTTSYAANLIAENGQFSGATTELSNAYPTSRTLSNIINSSLVSPGTAGFMNWIVTPTPTSPGHGPQHRQPLDSELNTIISTTFGFPRLTDLTGPVATNPPADNVTAPNDDCVAEIPVTANGSSTVTIVGGGNFPNDVIKATDYSSANQAAGAGTVTGPAGASIPAGTTVTSEGAGSPTTHCPTRLPVDRGPSSSSGFRRCSISSTEQRTPGPSRSPERIVPKRSRPRPGARRAIAGPGFRGVRGSKSVSGLSPDGSGPTWSTTSTGGPERRAGLARSSDADDTEASRPSSQGLAGVAS